MMWQLFHKWFGWHYICFRFAGDWTIARVKRSPNGQLFVEKCGAVFLFNENGTLSRPGGFSKQWRALTWDFEPNERWKELA